MTTREWAVGASAGFLGAMLGMKWGYTFWWMFAIGAVVAWYLDLAQRREDRWPEKSQK